MRWQNAEAARKKQEERKRVQECKRLEKMVAKENIVAEREREKAQKETETSREAGSGGSTIKMSSKATSCWLIGCHALWTFNSFNYITTTGMLMSSTACY